MAGSPKKRARRLAQQASRAGARARGKALGGDLLKFLSKLKAKGRIPPISPDKVPSDARLLLIAKGVLLALATKGAPDIQVKAAWQLADVARRTAPAKDGEDLETMTSEQLEVLAAQAQARLQGATQ